MIELRIVAASIFFVVWILFAFYLTIGWLGSTPFYPSQNKHLKGLLDGLKINPKDKKLKFVDIGSGDGRVVIWAAKQGFKATGIELNPFLTLISRLKSFIFRLGKNAKFINGNFYNQDYSEYDVVYLYIYREHMNKLKEKLFEELEPGSVIVSNIFKFDETTPYERIGRFNVYRIK